MTLPLPNGSMLSDSRVTSSSSRSRLVSHEGFVTGAHGVLELVLAVRRGLWALSEAFHCSAQGPRLSHVASHCISGPACHSFPGRSIPGASRNREHCKAAFLTNAKLPRD